MGMIEGLFNVLFGGGRNMIRDTAEVFRENAEQGSQRGHDAQGRALQQFGAEFTTARGGRFDRFMDGVNRLPRPALALGTLGLFVAAMVDPLWFAARMQGIALVPEPLWWLLGVIVSFYFGARHQTKSQEFQRGMVQSMVRLPQIIENVAVIGALRADSPGVADAEPDVRLVASVIAPDDNPALAAWRAEQHRDTMLG